MRAGVRPGLQIRRSGTVASSLFSQNCEHFTSCAYTSTPVSKQLQAVALTGLGALAPKVAFSESH